MEALLEGALTRLLGGRLRTRDLALHLGRALEDSHRTQAAATQYTLRLHPSDAQLLLGEQPRLADKLAGEILLAAQEAGIVLPQLPEVMIRPDPAMKRGSVAVKAEGPLQPLGETQGLTVTDDTGSHGLPPAFLILDGARTVPLNQTVVNLGRRLDNHIILDDARVSRAHAQLRLRFGRYVIYDLGSTSGTFINGQRVEECVLRAGDVISLGGVSVIYGEDDAAPRPVGGTEPNPPARA